jgi:hypothetical protein
MADYGQRLSFLRRDEEARFSSFIQTELPAAHGLFRFHVTYMNFGERENP